MEGQLDQQASAERTAAFLSSFAGSFLPGGIYTEGSRKIDFSPPIPPKDLFAQNKVFLAKLGSAPKLLEMCFELSALKQCIETSVHFPLSL